MAEYTVGSVAGLISNTKSSKSISKKGKLNVKYKEQGPLTVKKGNKKDKSSSDVIDSKRNFGENAKNILPLRDDGVDSTSADIKNSINEDKTVGKSKKRKKHLVEPVQNVADNPEISKNKRSKIDFDHVPTDSEEEQGEDDRNLMENKKVPNRDAFTDFKENTIFIGNIPIAYTKQKICKVFSKFGEIANARIRCVPVPDINMSKKVAAIKRKFNPKRNSLVAYVKYKSQESLNKALQANGMVIDGHHLRIDHAEGNQGRESNKAVFVGGLPFDIEDDELWDFFQNCGQIKSVRVIRDSQTLMGKGFGYVNFHSTAAVELALQLDGLELKKRTINVKRCVTSRKKNKLNSFGRKKSEEVTDQLLCKKGKKFKDKKNKLKKDKKQPPVNFQGKMANVKQKKKKKLSKTALRQRKIVKILGAP